jgi:heptosyltransferase-2
MVLDAQPMEVLNRKFLVLQTAFLGDAVLSLPFLQTLKKLNPDCLIDIITIPTCREIFAACPAVNQVFVLDKHGAHKGLRATIQFARTFARAGYERFYSLHRSFRSALFARATRIPDTFGFTTAAFSFLYTHKIPYEKSFHEVRRLMNFTQSAECVANWKVLPEMRLSDQQNENVAAALAGVDNSKPWIAIAPGSVWQTKRYPELYFKQIIDYFRNVGYEVILLGGKTEAPLCEGMLAPGVHNFAGKISIVESKLVIEKVKALLTNDSATTHVGMAANAKTITIYCSTVPSIGFYPYNDGSTWISKDDLPCKPCGIHGRRNCPKKHFKCGIELLPESIISKMESVIAK